MKKKLFLLFSTFLLIAVSYGQAESLEDQFSSMEVRLSGENWIPLNIGHAVLGIGGLSTDLTTDDCLQSYDLEYRFVIDPGWIDPSAGNCGYNCLVSLYEHDPGILNWPQNWPKMDENCHWNSGGTSCALVAINSEWVIEGTFFDVNLAKQLSIAFNMTLTNGCGESNANLSPVSARINADAVVEAVYDVPDNFGQFGQFWKVCDEGDVDIAVSNNDCMTSYSVEVKEASWPLSTTYSTGTISSMPAVLTIPASAFTSPSQASSFYVKVTTTSSGTLNNPIITHTEEVPIYRAQSPIPISVGQANYFSCERAPVTMTATGPGTLSWVLLGSAVGSGTSHTENGTTQDQIYTIESSQECSIPATCTLSLASDPIIDLSGIQTDICDSETPFQLNPAVTPNTGSGVWSGTSSAITSAGILDPIGNGSNVSGWSYNYGLSPTYTHTSVEGCVSSASLSLTYHKPSELNLIALPTCEGLQEGSASIAPAGNSPFTGLQWTVPAGTTNPTYGTNSASNLNVGSGAVSITDNSGCTLSESFQIQELDAPELDVITTQDVTDPVCMSATSPYALGGSNIWGTIDLNWTGGTGNYQIIRNGVASTSNISGTSFSYGGLVADNYSFKIEDANGCQSNQQNTTLYPEIWMNPTINTSPATCFGINNGQIQLNITNDGSGGSTTYSYSWSTGSSSNPITGLGANAEPDVTVTTPEGCVLTINDLAVGSQNQNPFLVEINPVVEPTCTGIADGELTADPSISTVSYAWSTGANTAQITGLDDGGYTVTVTNTGSGALNGCKVIKSVPLEAPEDEWQQKSDGFSAEGADRVETDADGNVYVLGTFKGETSFDGVSIDCNESESTVYYLTKYDECGTVLWVSYADLTDAGAMDFATADVMPLGTEVYVFLHTSTSSYSDLNIYSSDGGASTGSVTGNSSTLVLELDAADGGFISEDQIPEFDYENNDDLVNDVEYEGSEFFLAGKVLKKATISSYTFGSGSANPAIENIDQDLNAFTDIEFDGNGRLYGVGNTEGSLEFDGQTMNLGGSIEGFILKTDNSLNPIALGPTFHHEHTAVALELATENYGLVLVAGSTIDPIMDNMYVVALNTNLDNQWTTQFDAGQSSASEATAMDLLLDENDNLYATGTFTGNTIDVTDNGSSVMIEGGNQNNDLWIGSFNVSTGQCDWLIGAESQNEAVPTALAEGSGNAYVVGHFSENLDFYQSSEPNLTHDTPGQEAMFAIRFGTGYNQSNTGGFYKYAEEMEKEDAAQVEEQVFTLIPNPTRGQVDLTWLSTEGTINVRIVDISGKQVQTHQMNGEVGRQTIDFHGRPAGIYFMTIEANGQLWQQKLIKY